MSIRDKSVEEKFLEYLRGLSDEDRVKILTALTMEYCESCGIETKGNPKHGMTCRSYIE